MTTKHATTRPREEVCNWRDHAEDLAMHASLLTHALAGILDTLRTSEFVDPEAELVPLYMLADRIHRKAQMLSQTSAR